MPLIDLENKTTAALLRKALLIRRVEEKLLDLFSQGKLNGTVHTCIGQEWSAVAVISALKKATVFFPIIADTGIF